MNIWRLYAFLLPWTIQILKCICQIPLLTVIEDRCITNTSSAMAMLYDWSKIKVSKWMEPENEVSEIKSPKQSTDGIKGICGSKDCFNMYNDWTYVNSLYSESINNLITDKRWESLKTLLTVSTRNKNDNLHYVPASFIPDSPKFDIPFSLLQAEQEGHVFLCEESKVSESKCIWFLLQAWSGTGSGYRKCFSGEIQYKYGDGSVPLGFCKNNTIKKEHGDDFPKFLEKDGWTHLKIVRDNDQYHLQDQSGTTIITANASDFSLTPKYLFFHTKTGTGLWKVHNFDYFFSKTSDAYIGLNGALTFSNGRNCLTMFVVTCQHCFMDIHLISRGKIIQQITTNTQYSQWEQLRFIFHITEKQEHVFLRILTRVVGSSDNVFWAFNDLRACDIDEVRVLKPAYPTAWTKKCQLLNSGTIMKINENREISVLENSKNCKENEFGENCLPCEMIFDGASCPTKSKYCSLFEENSVLKDKCYCSIGYENLNCKEPCNGLSYGHGCLKNCKNCQDKCSEDTIFGKCNSAKCYDNFLGEKCDIKNGIFLFKDLPDIEVGLGDSCNLTMKSFNLKKDYRKTVPKYYRFQYKELNKEDWSNAPKDPITFGVTRKVTLLNLKMQMTYSVRVFGFNTENQNGLELVSKNIEVVTFTTKCLEIKKDHIMMEANEFTVRIWFNIDKENYHLFCDPSKYSFIVNNQPLQKKQDEYIINNLKADTDYSLIVKDKENQLLFTIYFRTKESVLEQVQDFDYDFKTPSELLLTWAQPKKMNGPLLSYYISFQLKYMACKGKKNQGNEENFTISVSANAEGMLQNVKPFVEYHIEIAAHTSMGFGPSVSKIVTINEAAPNIIKQLEVTSRGSDHVSLRWLQPYPPTGRLEKYRVSHYLSRHWFSSTKNWESFTIEPTKCKLWPNFHCVTFPVYPTEYKRNCGVKIEAKNRGSTEYSKPVEKGPFAVDDKNAPDPPYDLKLSWTDENYLSISWYHPNATNGILSGFKIYVNKVNECEYKINSPDDYLLVYTYTKKNNLALPNIYEVEVGAVNKFGESNRVSVDIKKSPPPIPEESIKTLEAEEESISITFDDMKQYGSRFRRYLYVLITECDSCREQLNTYKKALFEYHQKHKSLMSLESFRQQWNAISAYDVEKSSIYPKELIIGNNTTNVYNIKPKTKYIIACIWVHEHDDYVRINATIVSVETGPILQEKDEDLTGTIELTLSIVIPIVLITLVLIYIRKREEIHDNIAKLVGCSKASNNHDSPNNDNQRTDISLNTYENISGSRITRNMPDTICPGNPLFRFRNSRRVKLEDFRKYVKDAIESNELNRQYQLFTRGPSKSWTYGLLPQNKAKNRYNDVIAYDDSRVILNKIEGDEHSDYINATYINGYQFPRAYIATQGPKENTLHDFWRMVWQEKITQIVILANVYEEGKKKLEQYWPNKGESLTVEDFTIILIRSEVFANYEYRTLLVLYKNSNPREIGQLHFTIWPDEGVPLHSQTLIPVLEKMLTFRSSDFPILVHCSAGVGRTGTIILCDISLRMAAAEGYVDILAMLEHLTNRRVNMIDNVEQYKLVHLVILNSLMGLKTSIPIDQHFATTVDALLQNDGITTQLQSIKDCEWEYEAMRSAAFLDNNKLDLKKNRYPGIIPDDVARVYLNPFPPSNPDPSSTYINAVRVDGLCEPGRFIVTQFPLPDTIGDFWRLVVEKEISEIICLNDIPKNDYSCRLFFPIMFDEFSPQETIKVKHIQSKNFQVYTILTFEMTVSHPHLESKTLTTLEIIKFRGWKSSDLIPDYADFLAFVEDSTNDAKKSFPTLITCYDGATASGLYIAMSLLIEKFKLENICDVCQVIRSIRTSRKQFTNSKEQLTFLYKASLLYVENKFGHYSTID